MAAAGTGGAGGGGRGRDDRLASFLLSHPATHWRARLVSDLIEFECATTAREALSIMLKNDISGAPVYIKLPEDEPVRA